MSSLSDNIEEDSGHSRYFHSIDSSLSLYWHVKYFSLRGLFIYLLFHRNTNHVKQETFFLNTNTSKNGRNIHVTDYDETQAFRKLQMSKANVGH